MTRRLFDLATRALDCFVATLATIAAAATIALVLVTVIAVVFRYAMNDPIFGIGDISTMLLSVVVSGSIIYGAKTGAHVQVDILNMFGGRRLMRFFDIIVHTLCAAIAFFLVLALWEEIQCGEDCGYFTPNLELPHAPFHVILLISMLGYGALQVLSLLQALLNIRAVEDRDKQS